MECRARLVDEEVPGYKKSFNGVNPNTGSGAGNAFADASIKIITEYISRNKFALCEEGVAVKVPFGLQLHYWNKIQSYTMNPDTKTFKIKLGKLREADFTALGDFDQVNRILSEHITKS
jgi:hypothetical protein